MEPVTRDLPALSSSLEDYLETVYLLVQDRGFARVKDIAGARNVKAASVSIALKRLDELGLVRHERREYVALTKEGEVRGRKVFSRHRLLTRFFEEVLLMPPGAAAEQACAMEHSLTDEAMDRFARFFEFLGSCSLGTGTVVDAFRRCPVGGLAIGGDHPEACSHAGTCGACRGSKERKNVVHLSELKSGQSAKVSHIEAEGLLRQRLLDMGLLPGTVVDLERTGQGGDPVWIRCGGSQLALRRSEARTVLVARD